MGCCGCSSSTSAKSAGIFGIIQGALWLVVDIYYASIFFKNIDSFNFVVDSSNYVAPYSRILCLVITTEMKRLLVISAIFSGLSLLCSILLLHYNSSKNAVGIRQWAMLHYLTVLFNIGFTIYFSIKTKDIMVDIIDTTMPYEIKSRIISAYVLLTVVVDKGGPIMWIVNICFAASVSGRATEIKREQDVATRPTFNPQAFIYPMGANFVMNPTPNNFQYAGFPQQPNTPYFLPVQMMSQTRPMTGNGNFNNGAQAFVPQNFVNYEKPPSYNHHEGYFSEGEGRILTPVQAHENRGYVTDG